MSRELTNQVLQLGGRDFAIKEVIGRGASCVVYRTVCPDNTEHLLKEYNPKNIALHRNDLGVLCLESEEDRTEFEMGLLRFREGHTKQRELRLDSDLKNSTSNVQDIYCAYGTEYIDMTCFAGHSYEKVQEMSVYDLLRRMKAVAQVLGNYHAAGLLHLDMKPQNIFTLPETCEMVMLFDFDSVVHKNAVSAGGARSYTLSWAAPEQINPMKRRSICEATDIFAVGEMIFYQLMGRHSDTEERRSFANYAFDHRLPIFENVNPKVFPMLEDLLRHTICGAIKGRYQSAVELIAKLDEIIAIADPKAPYLKSSLPAVQNFFVGRDAEIEGIHQKLSEDRILFLRGIGGIGKSELAKHYALEHKDDYDAIIFAPYVSDINMLLQDDNAIPLHNFMPHPEEKPEEYCARKLKKLQELCDERTLFIVDNLDSEDQDLNKLLDLECKLLITTRMDFSDYGYGQQLYLDALCDRSNILEIFHKYYTKPLTEEENACVEQIIDLVAGHTMTVELLAKQMMAGRVKPEKMLAKLQEGGISESGKEKVRSGKDGILSTQSAYDHIQALFDLSELDKDERHILANLSLIPYTGISAELFHEWCELDNYENINNLVAEGWVILDEKRDIITLHPIVADMCKCHHLSINVVATLLEHLNALLLYQDFYTMNEITFYSPLLSNMVISMLRINIGSRSASRFIYRAGCFFRDHTGALEFAENAMEKALEWDYENGVNDETFRLSVIAYISTISQRVIYFGDKYIREKKVEKWRTIYKNYCVAPEHHEGSNVSAKIDVLCKLASHYASLEDKAEETCCSQKIVQIFEGLSTHDVDEMFLSNRGCDMLYHIADAYENIGLKERAIELYYRVINADHATAETTEMAYWGIAILSVDREDWADGVAFYKQFYMFLCKHYPSKHKIYIEYYQFLVGYLLTSFRFDEVEDWMTISHKLLLETIAAFWEYKHLVDQYYDELTRVDNYQIDRVAKLICQYVMYYIEKTLLDYEGHERWPEADYKRVKELLPKAQELFEITEADERERFEHYIQIFNKRKIADDA